MSVSTDVEVSENTQQNEEQGVIVHTEDQEAVSQNENNVDNEDQESAPPNTDPTAPDTTENNQENIFDLEKSKAKLEYISIALALISVISTGLVKVFSLGTHLQFNFDINNYEFKLTNNDFIILFLSALFCIFAIIFCYETRGIRNFINNKINYCLQGKFKERKYLQAFLWIIIFLVPILVYLILGLYLIYLICGFKGIAPFLYELWTIFIITFLFVIFLYCFALVEMDKNKIINKILCILLFVSAALGFMYLNYEKAVNQREFEIIVEETGEGKSQEYVVISKGNSYSAYQCSIEEHDSNRILIIHTDLHRYFPLDDTETRLNIFDEYQLYKYGEPLDALDEENNSQEQQSNDE